MNYLELYACMYCTYETLVTMPAHLMCLLTLNMYKWYQTKMLILFRLTIAIVRNEEETIAFNSGPFTTHRQRQVFSMNLGSQLSIQQYSHPRGESLPFMPPRLAIIVPLGIMITNTSPLRQ